VPVFQGRQSEGPVVDAGLKVFAESARAHRFA